MRIQQRKLAVLFFAGCLGLYAQTSRGTVSGLVLDAQKAAVPGASVELTNLATSIVRTASTNEAGLYRFDAVDPGDYKLAVKHQGFRVYNANKVSVSAANVTSLDVQLEIGEVQQSIEVTASAVALQTDAPVRGGTLESAAIVDLPYQSRNPADLGLTVPGVVTNKFATPAGTYVVNGTRGRSNNFMIDGTDNNDISVAGQAFTVRNPGSVVEVSIQTTNYDAEFGRAGGAIVNVITKSGGNALHGTAGLVLDTTWDDAVTRTFKADPTVKARGHNLPGTEQQFDGTLGGPIIKNKTFFYASYLELRRFATAATEMKSLTANGRATLLRLFPKGTNANADLLQQITAGYDGVTFPETWDLGNGRPGVEFGRLITPYADSTRIRQYGAKIDHHFSDRDILAGRFLIDDLFQPHGGETLSFPSFNTGAYQKTESVSAYYTHVFSPTMTNEFRPGFTRFNLDGPIDATNPLAKTLPLIAIQGVNTASTFPYGIRSNFPQGRVFNDYMIQDTMSIVRGSHTFRFGTELMDQRARQLAPFNERGTLSYNTSTGFSGLANFIDNFGGSGGGSTKVFGSARYYPSLFRQSYFFQDRWRATQSLTVSLGMRYEYFGTPMNVLLNPVFSGLFNVNPVTLDSPLFHANRVEPDKNNWSPSAGIAYSPAWSNGVLGRLFGDRKSVFRMGYGIGYDNYFNNITSNMVAGAPNAISANVSSVTSTALPRGLANLSASLPATPPPVNPATVTQTSVYGNLRNPYYQRWSAGIQRELPKGILLDMSYVGSKGTRLYASEDLNPLVTPDLRGPVPANSTLPASQLQPRLDPMQNSRLVRTNGASSSYHSAQLEVKRRFAGGFGITGAYTFSKAIDNATEIFSYGNTSTLQNASVPSLFGGLQIDKAVGSFHHPHRFVSTYDYVIPFMKEQHGPLGHVLGGWQLIGITTYETGTPFSVVNGQDADGLGGATYDRPNFNPNGLPGVRARPDSSSPTGYVDPDANSAPIDPATARYIGIAANTGTRRAPPGNLGRNTEHGPGLKDWDVNFVKTTKITERFNIELRAEMYNIWNTPMFGTVSVSPFSAPQSTQGIPANVFSSSPGQFLNPTVVDGGGRVIRYQLRLHF